MISKNSIFVSLCVFIVNLSTLWATSTSPNVLFIAVDDLKPLLGCYGDEHVKSPHIDSLAKVGTTFLNAHCQQAVCGPSRASLMTGRLPDYTKVWDLKTRMRDMNPTIVTIPQYFRNHGYEAVGIGKIYDPRCVDGYTQNDAPSWSKSYVHVDKNPDEEFGLIGKAFVNTVRRKRAEAEAKGIKGYGPLKNYIGGVPATEGSEDVADDAYEDGRVADRAVQLISELSHKNKPFFIATGFKKPHLPFVAPKKYWDLYNPEDLPLAEFQEMPSGAPSYHFQDSWELKNGSYSEVLTGPGKQPIETQRKLIHGYYACISYIDTQIGKLLNALDDAGIRENTVLVLWGDHGFHLGDHGMFCKHTNYEQATRSPLLFVDFRQKNEAMQAKAPVEFVDIFPTLCELAGLAIPPELDGESLVPILEGSASSVKPFARSQFPRHIGDGEAMGYAYRSERYRYIEWVKKDYYAGEKEGEVVATELYDYRKDPLEKRNLVDEADYAEVLAKFKAQLGPHSQ